MIIENIYVTESNSKDTDSLLQNNSHFGRLSPKFEDGFFKALDILFWMP